MLAGVVLGGNDDASQQQPKPWKKPQAQEVDTK
jgi:hypothetical protein